MSRSILILLLTAACSILLLLSAWSISERRWQTPCMVGKQALYKPEVSSALSELHYAIETMQGKYFQVWLGTWPTSIDWTGAVLGTYISAVLYSLSRSLDYVLPPHSQQPDSVTTEGSRIENEINRYFSQAIAYYFGEDAFDIRMQAYDDMLWVVLGWLENIRFIDLHTNAHYPDQGFQSWYGRQFTPAFAHRARVFFDIASNGWDTRDCGGGMIWNPRLIPYKNAITNELYISAAVSMYMWFPGDSNSSPFASGYHQDTQDTHKTNSGTAAAPAEAHDPIYLRAARDAYDWLIKSNMTNDQGLFVDGFHISHSPSTNNGGKCDIRNEMVYTYNQGVILSGMRGLWESTGDQNYLEDGHRLVRSVIAATGFDLSSPPSDDDDAGSPDGIWKGLGRNGILEEICDASGSCSQDSQGFKGIFFHHFTQFCEPLPRRPRIPGVTLGADAGLAHLHQSSCKQYSPWVARNAMGAMRTRDRDGMFGMWWGFQEERHDTEASRTPEGAEDYRNKRLGDPDRWGRRGGRFGVTPRPKPAENLLFHDQSQAPLESPSQQRLHSSDANSRGRGRTVETQGGGVAVVRSMWEFISLYS